MSFWEAIGGLFNGDTFYPDNVNREARFKQLNGQCENYLGEIRAQSGGITALLKDISDKLSKFTDIMQVKIPLPPDPIYEKIPYKTLSEVFMPLFSVPAVSGALLAAFVLSEAREGNALAATLTATLGVGAMWLSGGMFFGLMPVALVGMGAIEGAIKRDELRRLIPQAVLSRKKLYRVFALNQQIVSELQSMRAGLDVLISAVDMPASMVKKAVGKYVDRIKTFDLTEAEAAARLREQDRAMQAWTNEDDYSA